MKTIFLVTKSNELSGLEHRDIGLLLDMVGKLEESQYGYVLYLDEWLTNQEETLRQACELSNKILAGESCIDQVRQLTIFSELVSSNLERSYTVARLYNVLVAKGYERCVLFSSSWWGVLLQQYAQLSGSCLQVVFPEVSLGSRFYTIYQRIVKNKLSIAMLFTCYQRLIHKIDPWRRRYTWFRKKQKIVKDQWWFYSTAVNFTKVGMMYESAFPAPFHYLVENKLTGGVPLTMAKRKFSCLYGFMRKTFIPTAVDIAQAKARIQNHLETCELSGEEKIIIQLFLRGSWLQSFWKSYLPQGLLFSRLFSAWLQMAEPKVIVVGNHVYEGYLLQLAQHMAIPTVLLQHGVVANYSRYMDYLLDQYIVRGRFFYERLSPLSQARAIIYEPEHPHKVDRLDHVKKDHVLFLTSPFDFGAYLIDFDVESTLRVILESVINLQVKLIIRVHPLERIGTYEKLVNKILEGRAVVPGHIVYDQGSDIANILSRSFVALLFESTVFLDCMRHHVPMIGFSWYHSIFKSKLAAKQILHLAANAEEIETLIAQAQKGELLPAVNSLDDFFASASADVFRKQLESFF